MLVVGALIAQAESSHRLPWYAARCGEHCVRYGVAMVIRPDLELVCSRWLPRSFVYVSEPFVVKKTSVTVCEDLYKTTFVVHCQILAQLALSE